MLYVYISINWKKLNLIKKNNFILAFPTNIMYILTNKDSNSLSMEKILRYCQKL